MRREWGATNCMVLSGGRGWGLAVAAETRRKKDREEGTALFLFKSPRGCFGTVMMGYERRVGGGVVLLPPPMLQPPTPPLLSLVGDLHTRFVEGGDSQAGPLRRVCPAGWSCLMSVCMCVFGCTCMRVCVYLGDGVYV